MNELNSQDVFSEMNPVTTPRRRRNEPARIPEQPVSIDFLWDAYFASVPGSPRAFELRQQIRDRQHEISVDSVEDED